MRTPIQRMLDAVEWTCTKCGTPQQQGCHCFDRTTPAEKETIATEVRMEVFHYIQTMYPEVWQTMSRSARTSIPRRLDEAVRVALGRLDP